MAQRRCDHPGGAACQGELQGRAAGGGTAGTAPGWGKLLRMCGCAETVVAATSVTYNPVSDDHESGTLYFYVGKTLHKLVGTRGNAKFMVSAQGIPYIEFEFTGLFTDPAEATRPTPDLSAFLKPSLATSANTPTGTINGTDFVIRALSLDLGNQVENRFLIGSESVLITDRQEVIEATVEAQPLTSFDPYALARAQSEVAVVVAHGTTAGKIVTLNAPAAQMQRVQGLENAQNITEWPLRLVPLASSGNDQWTLVLT
ncbi:phage tail tube protein [Marinovum sp. B10]|uniref:phage tail tube protein n=1 Tax=Marinovum sp. B10 TaxID=3449224 RepID=UPI003EDC801D